MRRRVIDLLSIGRAQPCPPIHSLSFVSSGAVPLNGLLGARLIKNCVLFGLPSCDTCSVNKLKIENGGILVARSTVRTGKKLVGRGCDTAAIVAPSYIPPTLSVIDDSRLIASTSAL